MAHSTNDCQTKNQFDDKIATNKRYYTIYKFFHKFLQTI